MGKLIVLSLKESERHMSGRLSGKKLPSGSQAGSTVKSILTNEKYRGDALLQKVCTVDFLSKRKKVNEGEVPQ